MPDYIHPMLPLPLGLVFAWLYVVLERRAVTRERTTNHEIGGQS